MKTFTPLFVIAALVGTQAAIAAPTTPAAKPTAVAKVKAVKKTAVTGRMVTTKTTTGKTITYDCSKAGNASKKACK